MKTVFFDLVDNVELKPDDAKWFHDCMEQAGKVLKGDSLEEYKQGLLAACLVEEREVRE